GNHARLPSGFISTVWLFGKGHQAVVLENLALRQQFSVYKPGRSVRAWSGAIGRFGSRYPSVEGVARSLVHRSSRHAGALAAPKIPAVLGAAFKQIGRNRAASRQFSDSH